MVILACGDRNWEDKKKIRKAILHEHESRVVSFLIEGGQRTSYLGSWGEQSHRGYYGADYLAKEEAKKLGIQTVECEANWDYYKKAAGPIRNQQQLNLALKVATDKKHLIVLAFHSDIKNSKGTKDMVKRAEKAGVKVKVIK